MRPAFLALLVVSLLGGCAKKSQSPPPGASPLTRPAAWQEVPHDLKSDTDKAVGASTRRLP
jgi:hypothetical protein